MAFTRTRPPSAVAATLRKTHLGTASVMFFLFGAVGPLLVVAGLMPTFFSQTGLTAAPIFFLTIGAIVALFSVGYAAMARRIQIAGAFCAFIRSGLGRPAGVAAAVIAPLAYTMLGLGLYGLFGFSMAGFAADTIGVAWPWQMWALIAWAAIAVLGLSTIEFSAKVLAVLSVVEIVVILVISAGGLAQPAAGHTDFTTLSPVNLLRPDVGPGLLVALLGAIGFEIAPTLAGEARDPRRTIPVATYLTVALITTVYVLAALAIVIHYGPGQVAAAAGQGPDMFFTLAGPLVATIGRSLLLTSVFAGLLAYHSAVGRYLFALGREQVLPAVFGRAWGRTGAPAAASLLQTAVGLAVIMWFGLNHLDPMTQLFFAVGTTGGFGVLVLLAATSIAVIVYFARHRLDESLWQRVIAPGVAALCLTAIVVLAVDKYWMLLGVAPGTPAATILPSVFAVAAAIGLLWALVLKVGRPTVYEAIALGITTAPPHESTRAGEDQ